MDVCMSSLLVCFIIDWPACSFFLMISMLQCSTFQAVIGKIYHL